eukprot:Skav216091  [mRNA]  locus=scaffold2042:182828:187536:- [translate_table: standard]
MAGLIAWVATRQEIGLEDLDKTVAHIASWVEKGPKEFAKKHPSECECPWRSLAIQVELIKQGFSATCQLLDVFQDDHYTYAVSELATGGDLFTWCLNHPVPTGDREA